MHDCWGKEENKHKHPNNYRPKGYEETSKQGNATVDRCAGGVDLPLEVMVCDQMVDCNVESYEEERPWDLCFDDEDDVDIKSTDVKKVVDCSGELVLANLLFQCQMML